MAEPSGSGLRLLAIADVAELCLLSPRTITRRRGLGDFPEPVALSAKRVAWREEDVLTWIASRPAVSSGERRSQLERAAPETVRRS